MRTLFILLVAVVLSTNGFKPRRDPSFDSLSTEDDVDTIIRPNNKMIQRPMRKAAVSSSSSSSSSESSEEVMKPKTRDLFERPSQQEILNYDNKVQNERMAKDMPLNDDMIVSSDDKLSTDNGMEYQDEQLFLAAMGQLYLKELDNKRAFGNEPDAIFFPIYDEPTKSEANNNNNNNVHVNVNHVKVKSTVLAVGAKKDEKKTEEMPPVIPAYRYEPSSSSNYVYFNLNMVDALLFIVVIVGIVFLGKQTYKKCFPKKPTLPTTAQPSMPPVYSPTTMVETVKKTIPQ